MVSGFEDYSVTIAQQSHPGDTGHTKQIVIIPSGPEATRRGVMLSGEFEPAHFARDLWRRFMCGTL